MLVAGGIITVASSCFFGVPNFRFHLLQVLVLSFLISLVLVAIADIDQPYQGAVKVAPEGFEFAAGTLHNRRVLSRLTENSRSLRSPAGAGSVGMTAQISFYRWKREKAGDRPPASV